MESLGLTVDFEFFKESMNYFRWLDEQQRAIEKIFDCDIYGGPMKAWNRELDLWKHILKKEQSMGLLCGFASCYGFGKLTNKFSYEWDNKKEEPYSYDYSEEIVELSVAITDDNWLKVVWETLLRIEGGENERN